MRMIIIYSTGRFSAPSGVSDFSRVCTNYTGSAGGVNT